MRKTWNIYGQKIKLKYVDSLIHPETGAHCLGMYDFDKETIYIRKGLSKKVEYHTLTHELVHAMQFRLGYMQTNFSIDFIEQMAETFGNMIAENFKPK